MRDKMRERKSRKSHCLIFKEFFYKSWWEVSRIQASRFICHLGTHIRLNFPKVNTDMGPGSSKRTRKTFIFSAMSPQLLFSREQPGISFPPHMGRELQTELEEPRKGLQTDLYCREMTEILLSSPNAK